MVQVGVCWVITGRLLSSAAVGHLTHHGDLISHGHRRLHLESVSRLVNRVLHLFHAGFHLSLVVHVMLVQALGILEVLHNKSVLRIAVHLCNSLGLLGFAQIDFGGFRVLDLVGN